MFIKSVKENWLLVPIYAAVLSISIFFVFNTDVITLILPVLMFVILVAKYKSSIRTAKKYWISIVLIAIVMLSFYVRILDYNWPYLRNIDSYMFFRQMDYIAQNNGVMPAHDNLILAPDGGPIRNELFPFQYLGAYTFMFTSTFFPGLQLWEYLIYFPALLASLAAIPMYYIGKMLYNKKAGILAAVFYIFDFSNILRSLGGDPDTDAIVILVPVIVIALFIFTYNHINKNGFNKRSLIYSIITGISMGLWAHTWEGYWFVLWLITAMVSVKILIFAMRHRKLNEITKQSLPLIKSYVIIFVLLFLITYPAYGTGKINDFLAPFKFQQLKSEEGIEFPNVFISVAELQGGDVSDAIQRTSAISFDNSPIIIFISPFFLMMYTLIYLTYSFYKKRQHIDTFILLLVWFLGPFLATVVAIRFSTLFSAPLALGSAIILSKIINVIAYNEKVED